MAERPSTDAQVEHVGHYKWASPKALQDLDANGDGRIGIDEWVSHVLVLEEETSDGDFAAAVDEWMKVSISYPPESRPIPIPSLLSFHLHPARPFSCPQTIPSLPRWAHSSPLALRR